MSLVAVLNKRPKSIDISHGLRLPHRDLGSDLAGKRPQTQHSSRSHRYSVHMLLLVRLPYLHRVILQLHMCYSRCCAVLRLRHSPAHILGIILINSGSCLHTPDGRENWSNARRLLFPPQIKRQFVSWLCSHSFFYYCYPVQLHSFTYSVLFAFS